MDQPPDPNLNSSITQFEPKKSFVSRNLSGFVAKGKNINFTRTNILIFIGFIVGFLTLMTFSYLYIANDSKKKASPTPGLPRNVGLLTITPTPFISPTVSVSTQSAVVSTTPSSTLSASPSFTPTPSVSISVTGTITPTPTIALYTSQTYGKLESVTCSTITGWAYNPSSHSTTYPVWLYADSTYLGTTDTDIHRQDVNSSLNINGTHGFSLPVFGIIRDGKPHNIYAFVEISGIKYQLGNTPLSLTCVQ